MDKNIHLVTWLLQHLPEGIHGLTDDGYPGIFHGVAGHETGAYFCANTGNDGNFRGLC